MKRKGCTAQYGLLLRATGFGLVACGRDHVA